MPPERAGIGCCREATLPRPHHPRWEPSPSSAVSPESNTAVAKHITKSRQDVVPHCWQASLMTTDQTSLEHRLLAISKVVDSLQTSRCCPASLSASSPARESQTTHSAMRDFDSIAGTSTAGWLFFQTRSHPCAEHRTSRLGRRGHTHNH